MTMAARARSVPAAEFKAKCLSLLDEVAATGVPLIVTKRGIAVARVEPIGSDESRDLRGSVVREGDLISPIDDTWSAES
jgi:prevent-host-death family protein